LFVRTTDGLVGAGGYSGLTNRLQTYHRKSGNHYPLAYQVVTHHHSDHLGGIGEAATMGAKLLTQASNFEVIKEGVTDHELEDSDFVAVTSRMTISEGKDRVEIYEVSTAHSYAYLVVYVPT
jgi:glyoxylase-like metal-dependent hydrolase (beta-lactamase superfamily II)